LNLNDLNKPTFRDLAIRANAADPSAVNSPFRPIAEGTLADLRSIRGLAVAQVKSGDMTVKVARESLKIHADKLASDLREKATRFSTVPAHFAAVLTLADETRARREKKPDELQRENNALLRRMITVQEIANRTPEFERSLKRLDVQRSGTSDHATLDGMFAFLDDAKRDPVATEWAKRQLAERRHTTASQSDRSRIEAALASPGEVSDSMVESYIGALKDVTEPVRAAFAKEALESADASACVAAFVVCQQLAQAELAEDWTRDFLGKTRTLEFPEVALDALLTNAAERQQSERSAALVVTDWVAAAATELAELRDVVPPTENELALAGRAPKPGPRPR
jgi:hypothetical protein